MKLTKSQIEEAVVTIYTKLIEGQTDSEIADDMGLSMEEFLNLKRSMFEIKAEEFRKKPREHVYVEYVIEQMQNIKDLSEIIAKFEETNQYTAIVGAIRTRADLLKSLLQMGQEFGIIHKEPERREIIAGVAVAELTNDNLKKLIHGELGELNKLYRQFSDQDIRQLESPKELYFKGLEEDKEIIEIEGKSEIKSKNNKSFSKEKIKRKKVKNIDSVKPKKKKREGKKIKVLSPLEAAIKAMENE